MERISSGDAEVGVLPVENSIQGGVLQVMDLLNRFEVFGIREIILPIDHRLVTKGNVPYEQINCVYSHEQAIGQCSEFLDQNFPHARRMFTQSTAESLKLLDEHSAGIVGSHVKGDGLVFSKENIANEKRNFTRFMLLKRGGELPEHSEKVFFCAVCAHRPGSLVGLLSVFAKYGLNLTRIESRPIRDVFGEYRFYIEFTGDIGSVDVCAALDETRLQCLQFRLLGAY
jgi:prephenate dehydratase